MRPAYEYEKKLLTKVLPAMSYTGEDYDQWKLTARKKLAELLGMDRYQKCEPAFQIESKTEKETHTDIRFSFQSEPGYRVPCHLLLPKNIEKPPLMITLQGHSTGMHVSLGEIRFPSDERSIKVKTGDFSIRAVKEGFAALALEQRNFGEAGALEDGSTGCLESSMTALLMGRTVIGERVWDLMRLVDVLEQEFADVVDLSALCCMGNSGGGTATAYFAALDDRIVLAMPSCAICDFTQSIGAMRHCTCNYIPHMAEYFGMDDLIAMAFPKFYVQVSGVEDAGFWIKGARDAFARGRRIYDECEMNERIALVEGPAGHRFYPDLAWPIVHKMLSR